MKNKMVIALIGMLVVGGLFLTGCENQCPGSAECTVTIGQGASGLYVDYDAPRSSCGKSKNSESSGCRVQNMMNNYNSERRYGTWSCDC